MADREKVIKGLELCKEACYMGNCPYWNGSITDGSCMLKLHEDALALLEEREPIAPSVCGSKEPDGHGSWWYMCGKCKKPIDHKDRFCKRCGQAVKWDE